MAFLGRDSPKDIAKKERWKQWITARPPLAIFALCAGLLSVIDSPIMVLSIPAGITAIIMSTVGLRRFDKDPHEVGRGTYHVAMTLGILGMSAGILMWIFLWPWLKTQAGN